MNGNLNKLMIKLMPMILQQEMEKQRVRDEAQVWLGNKLQEYKAYGGLQEEENKRGQLRDLFNKIIQPEFYKNYPDAAYRMVEAVKQQFPELGKELFLPEDFPGMKAKGDEAATRIAIAKQAGTDISPEDLKIYAQSRGITEPLATVGEITKARAEAASLGQRQAETTQAEKLIPLRKREVAAREAEVGLAKTGKPTPKELKADLEKVTNKRQSAIEKTHSLAPANIQNVRTYEISIDGWNREIAGLKKTAQSLYPSLPIGQITETDKFYQPMVDALMKRGITRQMLLTNKELEKELKAQGFEKWILLEYLK